MPIYAHACECGESIEEYRPIAEYKDWPTCPKCKIPMPKKFGCNIQADYIRPNVLQSMGFIADPKDVAEHRKRFPDVELVFDNGSAIPVMRSLNQKKRYLKAAGWADMRSFG